MILPCSICGQLVQRREKQEVATCFRCRAERNRVYSRKHYHEIKEGKRVKGQKSTRQYHRKEGNALWQQLTQEDLEWRREHEEL